MKFLELSQVEESIQAKLFDNLGSAVAKLWSSNWLSDFLTTFVLVNITIQTTAVSIYKKDR